MKVALNEERRYRAMLGLNLDQNTALEALVGGLYDESWRVRQAAADQLSRLPHRERAVPRLMAALGDRGQTGARNSAAEALIRLGLAAMPALVSLMSHPDPDQRKFAADILGGMRLGETAEVLIAALEDLDPNVRASAAEALGRIGGEKAVCALQERINHPDPLLRLSVLEGLADLASPPPLSALIPLLADARTRRTAYRLLGLSTQPAATELICRGLQSDLRSTREAALAALASQRSLLGPSDQGQVEEPARASLQSFSLRKFLPESLASQDRSVRSGALFLAGVLQDSRMAPAVAEAARDETLADEAIRALARMGSPAGSELLRHIDELSSPARAAAAEALARVADESHVAGLSELAACAEIGVQISAVKALGRSRSVEAIPILARLLRDDQVAPVAGRALVDLAATLETQVLAELEDSIAQGPTPVAISALARLGKAGSLPAVARTLGDPDPRVRAASAEAIAELGESTALELAALALNDEAPVVRCAAAAALGRISPRATESLLRRALADPDPWVQVAAIEAAEKSGSGEVTEPLEMLAASPDGLRAARAVRALAALKRLKGPLLEEASRHRDPEVVKEALLAGAGREEGLALALKLLAHRRWDVRIAAGRVLATSGGNECLEPIKFALESEGDPLAREALNEALEAISGPDRISR